MNSKLNYSLVLLLMALFGCEKTLDIPGPLYQKQVVITGLLQPDSVIAIRLTYTAPTNTTAAYEQIVNAQVALFDDGQLLGSLLYRDKGLYSIESYPKPGHTYRVVANVVGYGQVSAEDRMPAKPISQLRVDTLATGNPNNNPNFYVRWQPNDATTTHWLSFYVGKVSLAWPNDDCQRYVNKVIPPECNFVYVLQRAQNYIVTNSVDLDHFNGAYDSFSGSYTYAGFARFNSDMVLGKPVELRFTTYNQTAKVKNRKEGESNIVDLFAAGPSFDKFLRSVIQSKRNQITGSDDVLNNPFAEVTPIYSNVKGGLGIFGAVNINRFTN